ncbi:MAG: DUF3224 domain-containing protein [Candidatus Heimdallarchaeota archaeon]|nr:MAG: DUF3224 domain-containing protein [Candidatus Heimdallarchaeota archaeon]
MRKMRKKSLTFYMMCIVVLLFQIPTTMVQATQSTYVEAYWTYTPTIESAKYAGNKWFLSTTEVGNWVGDIVGTSNEIGRVVVHECDYGELPFCLVNTGFWFVKGRAYFTGQVCEKSGTFVLQFVGKRASDTSNWYGQWVILSGTGELATLHGQGDWWGPPGVFPPFDVYVSGNIHFE